MSDVFSDMALNLFAQQTTQINLSRCSPKNLSFKNEEVIMKRISDTIAICII